MYLHMFRKGGVRASGYVQQNRHSDAVCSAGRAGSSDTDCSRGPFPGTLIFLVFLAHQLLLAYNSSSSYWLIINSTSLSFSRSAVPSCSFCSPMSLSAGCVTSPSPCASSFSSICLLSSCPAFVTSSASLVSQISCVEDFNSQFF